MLRPPGAEAVCQHFMAASVALDFSDVYMTPHGTREVKHLVSTSALPSYSGWRMQGSWACSVRSEVLLPSSSWARRLEGTFKDYLVENDVATLINLNHLRQSSEKLQVLLFPSLSSSCCCCLCCLPAQKSLQTAEVQLTLCKQHKSGAWTWPSGICESLNSDFSKKDQGLSWERRDFSSSNLGSVAASSLFPWAGFPCWAVHHYTAWMMSVLPKQASVWLLDKGESCHHHTDRKPKKACVFKLKSQLKWRHKHLLLMNCGDNSTQASWCCLSIGSTGWWGSSPSPDLCQTPQPATHLCGFGSWTFAILLHFHEQCHCLTPAPRVSCLKTAAVWWHMLNELLSSVIACESGEWDLCWPHTGGQGLAEAQAKEKSHWVKGRGMAD